MKKSASIKFLLFIVFATAISVTSDICIAQTNSGYISLFNGKTLKGWKTFDPKSFKVADGTIVGTTGGSGFLATDKEYTDFVLELEIKVDGGTVKSGVNFHSGFSGEGSAAAVNGEECKIDPTSRKWTGGIFDNNGRGWLYPMDLNAKAKNAFKPGVYNHIKIECIANETKTWVNGIACAYVVDTINDKGHIALHIDDVAEAGKRVYFRNIKIKTSGLVPSAFTNDIYVVNMVSNSLNNYEVQDGWKLLFDGTTSTGWHSAGKTTFPQKGWKVGDGLISVAPPGGGDVLTDKPYKAFDLSFEFKTTPVANSGVKYFVTVDDKNSPLGLEYQVLDDALNPDAKLGRDGDRTEGSLYDLIPAKKSTEITKPVGKWNTGRIIVYPNNHVEHYLNGVKVLEYDRLSPEFKQLIAISKYKNYNGFGVGPAGYILLQDHGCVVSYRSIKIKEL